MKKGVVQRRTVALTGRGHWVWERYGVGGGEKTDRLAPPRTHTPTGEERKLSS